MQRIEQIVVLGSTVTALAVVRSAHSIGLHCHIVDRQRGLATSSRYARTTILNSASDEAIVGCLCELAGGTPSALVADSDAGLRLIAAYRTRLVQSFRLVLHPDNSVLDICLDKFRFLNWCQEKELPAPAIVNVDDSGYFPDTFFPVMVRPRQTRHGQASSLPKAIEISCAKDLHDLLFEYTSAGAIACVSSSHTGASVRQFSVGAARNRAGESRLFVAEKLRPSARFCGGGTYVSASPDDEVAKVAERALVELDYFGIAEVEILHDVSTQQMFIVEINPRPWVQYALAWRSGFDFLTFLVRPHEYEPHRERPIGGRWLYWKDDLYVVFSRREGMRANGEVALLNYVRTLFAANVHPVWSWTDIGPSLHRIMRGIKR